MAETENNFIYEAIDEDIREGKLHADEIHTRFPPEPNGYLHIGHCKALIIDFGTAKKYGGKCNLRMDDTNPAKEDTEFVDAIKEDIRWLGFDWDDRFYYGSDYFEKTYELAVGLIRKGLAYVCELTPEQFRDPAYCGDLTHPAVSAVPRPSDRGKPRFVCPHEGGRVPGGKYTLRAKIDLASGNFCMRDPVIYRIKYVEHHRQGTKWCIFPMYDFAHPIQDALEGVTHSLCSLEYEIHRPLYNWVIEHVDLSYHPCPPRQIEFARLNLSHTVMSKRHLRSLVERGIVDGWDDPRMPTLCGLRRRGYTARSILDFIGRIGVSKANSLVDIRLLESCIREELNETAPRRVCIGRPIKGHRRQLSRGKDGIFHASESSGKAGDGCARGAVHKGAVYRRRRFCRGPAAEVLPHETGRRGAAHGRISCEMRRDRQKSGRNRERDPLHGGASETGCGVPAERTER